MFNKTDHTGTLYGVRKVTKLLENDPDYRDEIMGLYDRLSSEAYREGLKASEAVGAFLAGLRSGFYTDDGWRIKPVRIRAWDKARV